MPWMHDRRQGADAPKDGTPFQGVAKGSVDLQEFVWDGEMECFLSTEFDLVDEISCWWPLPAPGVRPAPRPQGVAALAP